jgi:hypothetical protein
MANTKVTGDLIASGTITAANLVSGTLDTLLNSYLTTNTYATQGYVTTAVNNLIDAAPASLDTLNELAAALNDDANFATTVTNSLATKLNLSGGTISGNLSVTGTLTGTLATAAQPNITSVGTLTSLDVGNISMANALPTITMTDTDLTDVYSRIRASAGGLLFEADEANQRADTTIRFEIDADEKMRIDSGGNVGIGVTPFSNTLSNSNGIDFINNGGLFGYANGLYLTANAHYNSGWTYKGTDSAGILLVQGDLLTYRNSPSGTAATGITFTERFRIAANGNVGIGTTTPSAKLNVVGGVTVDANGVGNTVHVWDDSASGQQGFIVTNTGNQATSTHTLYLKNYNSGISASVFGQPIASKSIVASADGGEGLLFGTLSNKPIYIGTNGVERLRVLADGGLTFNGDTAAANALDDYEEGTWTPTFHYDFPPPSISYVNQEGYYQKVGNTVTVWFDLYATGMNSTNYYYARLGGLPFTMVLSNQYIKAPLHHSGNSNFSVGLRGGGNPVFYYNLNRTGFAQGVHVDSAYISGHFSYQIS